MLNKQAIQVFETLSGWTEKSNYEKQSGGHITIEEDIMTGEANAFLWRYDFDPQHLQYMRLGDLVFVKK
jgi:hypothetical protein